MQDNQTKNTLNLDIDNFRLMLSEDKEKVIIETKCTPCKPQITGFNEINTKSEAIIRETIDTQRLPAYANSIIQFLNICEYSGQNLGLQKLITSWYNAFCVIPDNYAEENASYPTLHTSTLRQSHIISHVLNDDTAEFVFDDGRKILCNVYVFNREHEAFNVDTTSISDITDQNSVEQIDTDETDYIVSEIIQYAKSQKNNILLL